MVCDDDKEMTARLVAALRTENHDARACCHTMDVLREATAGAFDAVALGVDVPGFGATGAIETLRELAPRVRVIGFHRDPAAFAASTSSANRPIAVLPRSISNEDFVRVVIAALKRDTFAHIADCAASLRRPSRESVTARPAPPPRHSLRLYDD